VACILLHHVASTSYGEDVTAVNIAAQALTPPLHKEPVLLPFRPAGVVHPKEDTSQPMEGFRQNK